jgi:GT2 family glycosyltransferase
VLGDCRLFCDLGERPRTLFEESGLDLAYWGGPALVQDPYGKLIRLNFIATGAVLVRRPVLELAGGFDPALRLVEDLDLWLRLALVCPFAYTTQVCEHKREHGGNVSGDRDAMALAYIRVLLAQASRRPGELRRRGIRIGPIVASEYSQIGYRREQARDRAGARRFYWAALAAHPSPRPLYYLARTWLPGRTAGTLGGGTRQGGAAP